MNLHILIRTHSDYDEHTTEVVGVTDQTRIANAFLESGSFGNYWTHEVEIVTLNVLQDLSAARQIDEWLDSAANPLCECGHRFLHHRRKNHTGSCKHNLSTRYIQPLSFGRVSASPHKCKGFKSAS